ncbi:MAG: 6-pyruvoyl tetrahydropterin synthase family protein [Clostridiaceae bacterium]
MFIIKSEIGFDASHYLSGYDGKCGKIHGHRYRLIVKVQSQELHESGPSRGMVEDFSFVKAILKEIHDLFDHKIIIEDDEIGKELIRRLGDMPEIFDYILVSYRPTAEEMARDIYSRIKAKGADVYEVELYETPTNSCIYREG